MPETAGPFGPDIVQLIARGDEKALAELYDQTSRMVFRLVLSIVGDAAAAEQVTLDVYMQVWRTASNYRPDRGSVTGWLAMIARTQALDSSGSQRPVRDVRYKSSFQEVE